MLGSAATPSQIIRSRIHVGLTMSYPERAGISHQQGISLRVFVGFALNPGQFRALSYALIPMYDCSTNSEFTSSARHSFRRRRHRLSVAFGTQLATRRLLDKPIHQ